MDLQSTLLRRNTSMQAQSRSIQLDGRRPHLPAVLHVNLINFENITLTACFPPVQPRPPVSPPPNQSVRYGGHTWSVQLETGELVADSLSIDGPKASMELKKGQTIPLLNHSRSQPSDVSTFNHCPLSSTFFCGSQSNLFRMWI